MIDQADQLYTPEVLDLFALHQDALQRIFCFYKRARKWEDVAQARDPSMGVPPLCVTVCAPGAIDGRAPLGASVLRP